MSLFRAILPPDSIVDLPRFRLVLTFGGGQLLILTLLVLMAVTLSRQYAVQNAARARLYESFETRFAIKQLLSHVQDIETGQRGFIITGNPEYLEPYNRALEGLDLSMSRLETLLQNNSDFAEPLFKLKELADARVQLSAAAVATRQTGTLADAADLVSRGEGKRVMDEIRKVIAEMQRVEALELDTAIRTEQSTLATSRKLTYGLAFAIAALSVFGAAWAYILIDRRRRAERKAERQSGIVKLLSEIADASNRATFEEALDKALEVLLRDTHASWGLTIRFDPRKKNKPTVSWQPAPQGRDPDLLADFIAERAQQLAGPALLDIPSSLGLETAIPSCSVVPIRDGKQVAGALFIAGPRPGAEDNDRQNARFYTIEQLSRAAERQRMLDTLTDTLARHEALFSSASEGIVTINESNTIERFNPAAETLFGYTAAEIERRDFTLLLDESAGPVQGLASKLLQGDGAPNSVAREAMGRRKDGTVFPIEISLSMMNLGERNVFVAFVRDVSERKKVERMQAEFVSTVSHELRTPLTSIGGSLGLIAGGAAGEISDRAKRLVDIAHKNSQRLVRLVNDILDIEKLESGKMTFQFASVPVEEFLSQVIAANRGFGERHGVGIVLSGCAAEAVVRADADRLNQALTNLLSNAMKFSPPGGTVEVGVNCSAKGVRISVTDHGPGIPENFRKRIFERFSQADSSDTRQTGGSGLGLSIAREIVTRHGGSLSYETEMGTGTTFHIDLPQAASLNHERWQLSPSDHEPVAICADDRAKAELICATLMSEGFSPTIFATPEEALQELGRLKPRAVVVDVPFGNQDVSQLVPALRDRCNSPVMPVIVVSLNATGSGMPEVALAFPIVDWITGPAELTRLPGLVRSLALRAAPDRPRILHVEDDRDVLEVVRQALDGEFNVTPAPTLEVARIRLAQERYDIVILDLTLSDGLGKDLIPALVDTAGRPIPTVVFSAQDATAELAVNVEAILTKSRANLATLVDAVRAVIARPPGDVVTRKGAVS